MRIVNSYRYPWALVRSAIALLIPNPRFPDGYRRIYHYHVRKSGGTSFNRAVIDALNDGRRMTYENLGRSLDHRLLRWNGRTVVGWHPELIRGGRYAYAFSHHPAHRLQLPPRTFTVTILRDPIARVVSHYRMLLDFRRSDSNHPARWKEVSWLGNGFSNFLNLIPREDLLSQLWMFSSRFEPQEALRRLEHTDAVLRTEELSKGIQHIGEYLNLSIRPQHARRSSIPFLPSESELAHLRGLLEPEYRLLRMATDNGVFVH